MNHRKQKLNKDEGNNVCSLIQENKEFICCTLWLLTRTVVGKTFLSIFKITFTESVIKLFVEYI